MPTTSIRNIAAIGDALNGLKFKVMGPSLVTVAAASSAAGGIFSYSVGSDKQLCVGAMVNIEISADVVDLDRDAILIREPAPAGEHFLDVTALGTTFNFVRVVEVA